MQQQQWASHPSRHWQQQGVTTVQLPLLLPQQQALAGA
jgi:hypothetical protein